MKTSVRGMLGMHVSPTATRPVGACVRRRACVRACEAWCERVEARRYRHYHRMCSLFWGTVNTRVQGLSETEARTVALPTISSLLSFRVRMKRRLKIYIYIHEKHAPEVRAYIYIHENLRPGHARHARKSHCHSPRGCVRASACVRACVRGLVRASGSAPLPTLSPYVFTVLGHSEHTCSGPQ